MRTSGTAALRAATVSLALLNAGCVTQQYITDHVKDSLAETQAVTTACMAVGSQYDVADADLRSALRDVVLKSLGLGACSGGDCLELYKAKLRAARQAILALATKARSTGNSLNARIQRVEDAAKVFEERLVGLRDTVEKSVQGLEAVKDRACYTDVQCLLRFEVNARAALSTVEDGLQSALDDLRELEAAVGDLRTADMQDLDAEGKQALAAVQEVIKDVATKIAMLEKTVTSGEWGPQLTAWLGQLVKAETGRLTVRILDRSVQSLDRLVERIDDKSWFAISLATTMYESDIRDAFERFFRTYFAEVAGRSGQNAADVKVMLVYGACEELGKLDDVQRVSYLMHPLLVGLILADTPPKDDEKERLKDAVQLLSQSARRQAELTRDARQAFLSQLASERRGVERLVVDAQLRRDRALVPLAPARGL